MRRRRRCGAVGSTLLDWKPCKVFTDPRIRDVLGGSRVCFGHLLGKVVSENEKTHHPSDGSGIITCWLCRWRFCSVNGGLGPLLIMRTRS